MPSIRRFFLSWFLAGVVNLAGAVAWPQFRGPDGLCVAENGSIPIHFGPSSNVVWKIEIPSGASSPCIWEDRIFLTAYSNDKLVTICVRRSDGNLLWTREAPAQKIEPVHKISGPASPTPATDGERVYVYFGSYGLIAYDFSGNEVWRKPLPVPMVEFGTGTSPILANNYLILLCDQDLGSYLMAVEPNTGRTVWRTERPEFRRGFATPFVWKHDVEQELIVAGSIWLKSYNITDGKERWTVHGVSRVANSSPTAGDGLLFSASWNVGGDEGERITMPPFTEFAKDHDKNKDGLLTAQEIPAGPIRERFTQMDLDKDGFVTPIEWQAMADMFRNAENAVRAVRPGGKGDITETHLAWKVTRSLPYVSSPLYYQGRLYTFKSGGLASCYEARTGKPHYQNERMDMPGDFYSSAVAAGDRILICSQGGIAAVLRAGNVFEVLARNNLGDEIMATPSIIGDRVYVRTRSHLFCFSAR